MDGATVQQFLEHLRSVGVVPPRYASASEPSSGEVLLREYSTSPQQPRPLQPLDRGVRAIRPRVRRRAAASRDASRHSMHRPFAPYLLGRSRNRSVSFVKLLAAALRSFLRFLFLEGMTQTDFSMAVPPVRRWRLAAVPPFLTAEEVERVIAATDRSTASGCRAHAMLLLLARLGLRAGEVAALELDDIRWDVGEIVVRGKGRVHDHLPLLDDVGEALALYLRDARGPSTSRRVFLRRCAPHVGLSGPTAVCLVARQALRRAGLMRAGRVGAHIFRHSLATGMIRRGASLAEIAQVLRHRSLDTTQLYAKVEFEALGGVALPWPSVEVQPVSALHDALTEYLQTRRALGTKLGWPESSLRQFVDFIEAEGEEFVTTGDRRALGDPAGWCPASDARAPTRDRQRICGLAASDGFEDAGAAAWSSAGTTAPPAPAHLQRPRDRRPDGRRGPTAFSIRTAPRHVPDSHRPSRLHRPAARRGARTRRRRRGPRGRRHGRPRVEVRQVALRPPGRVRARGPRGVR